MKATRQELGQLIATKDSYFYFARFLSNTEVVYVQEVINWADRKCEICIHKECTDCLIYRGGGKTCINNLYYKQFLIVVKEIREINNDTIDSETRVELAEIVHSCYNYLYKLECSINTR